MDEAKPKRRYFFQKGNTYSKGRPRVSLSKPDVLLPAIFNKAKINWAADFTRLYKARRVRKLTDEERFTFKMLYDLLPYLVVKVTLKEDELKKYLEKGTSERAAIATAALIRSLEKETNAPNSAPKESGAGPSVAPRESVLPPKTEPA